MQYRSIGATGLKASVIGLGCEHLDGRPYETVKETIDAALEYGVNIMDMFMPGAEVRQNLGRALGGRRDKVIIQGHIGSVDLSRQYDISRNLAQCKKYFEDLLRHLGTDYIDFGMLFFIDDEKAYRDVFEGDILPYAQNLKQRGVIRGIGASSHNPAMAAKVVESGVADLILFSVNPAFDMIPAGQNALEQLDSGLEKAELVGLDPQRARLYTLCQQRNVAITTMKTFGGGKLLSAQHSPFGKAMSPGQCIHYALSRPAVVSTLVGCQSRAEVEEAVRYLDMSEAQRDYTEALRGFAGRQKPACVYCNHCLPCPAGIDVAAVTKYLDIAALDEAHVPPSIAGHYAALDAHGGDCIQCGSCEGKCPFDVPVMQNMQRAKAAFGL